MKRLLLWCVLVTLCFFLVLQSACASENGAVSKKTAENETKAEEASDENTKDSQQKLKVVYVVNGVLGDRSLIDSAARGLKKAEKELGISLKIVEAGLETSKWKSYLEDAAANEDYDILVCGSYSMVEYLEDVAPKYPDKHFIIYDAPVDYSTNKFANVYSVTFMQNEAAYLGGAYAGLMTSHSEIEGINKDLKLGIVGAQPIPVINDFILPFIQAAGEVANIKKDDVYVQFAGGWNDPAKGKELAHTMYQQGADIVFQVAGGSGDGIFQAAKEVGSFAMGVDSDQHFILEEPNPELAKVILTSVVKNVDNSLFRAIQLHLDGKLAYGSAEAVGLKDKGVGLAKNDYFKKITPQDIQDKLDQIEEDIISGKIQVVTALK